MLEEERKYEVDAGFRLPDLAGCAPDGGRLIARPPMKLRATYYDTVDLRLARAGASLRFRRGDDEPWTVKLPTDAPGVRNEISMVGSPTDLPGRLLDLVTVYTRGAAVAPVTTLHTVRHTYQLCDADDRVAVEVVDDTVTVNEGKRVVLKFREIEAERKAGKAKLLDGVEAVLRDAGALPGDYHQLADEGSRSSRSMSAHWGWPPPHPPTGHCPRPGCPSAQPPGTSLASRLRVALPGSWRTTRWSACGRRLGAATRRSIRCGWAADACAATCARSPVSSIEGWATTLRAELGWISDALGVARDAEVLRARLRRTADSDPLAALDGAAVARIDADLAARHEDALQALDKAMCEERYHRLLDLLLDAARQPQVTRDAKELATAVLPGLVAKPWRRLRLRRRGLRGRGPPRTGQPGRGVACRPGERQAGPLRGGGRRLSPRR